MKIIIEKKTLTKTIWPWAFVMLIFIFGPMIIFGGYKPPYLKSLSALTIFMAFGILCYIAQSFINGAISVKSNGSQGD